MRATNKMRSPSSLVMVLILAFLSLKLAHSKQEQLLSHQQQLPRCRVQEHAGSDEITADCSGLNLTAVPTSLPRNVTSLDLSQNKISDVVSGGPLLQYPRLRVLNLSHNTVLWMEWGAFPGSLQQLDLSHNNISDICVLQGLQMHASTSANVSLLREVRFDYNNLTQLTEDCFAPIAKSLKILSLGYNRVSSVKNHTFRGLHALTYLTLNNNHLGHLEEEAFSGLEQLRTLSLAFNELYEVCSLPPGVFRPVGVTLTMLDLHGNKMSAYPDEALADLVAVDTVRLDTFSYDGDKPPFGPGFGAMRRLQVLDLSYNCQLNHLKNDTFAAFASTSLQSLVMTNCNNHIMDAEPCAFCPLHNLTALYIDYAKSISARLEDFLNTFYAFQLHGNEMQIVSAPGFVWLYSRGSGMHLTAKSMTHVQGTCVQELLLQHNYIVAIERGALVRKGSPFNACVRRIDLSYNSLLFIEYSEALSLHQLPQLRRFEIQQQRTFDLHMAAVEMGNTAIDLDLTYSPREIHLYIPVPPQIEFFNMSGTFYLLGKMPTKVTFIGIDNMINVDISYNRFIGCKTVLEGSNKLQTLNMSGIDCQNASFAFFDPMPRLKTLTLQKTTFSPSFIAHDFRRLFRNLTQLETLDLTYSVLERLPSDMLEGHQPLRQLLLAETNLANFDLDLDHLDNLTLLDLSRNRLTVLSEGARDSLDRLVARQQHPLHLHLQGNPLACTCATLDFVRWLMETRVVLDNDGDYVCATDGGTFTSTRAVGKQWMNAWRRCVGVTVLWSAVAAMLLMVLVTGAVWGVSKNISRLRFLYNVVRRVEIPDRLQFKQDAYVAYCDADAEFVYGRLKRELQERRRVRLLIKDLPYDEAGERQFYQVPGDNVALKMLEHIDLCWKVILVLTPALARDHMAGFMTRAVLGSITDRMPHRVLLLCVGVRDVPELTSVQALMETVPERQVFFLPEPNQRDHHLWDTMAQTILQ